jgi:hypothetical protein
MKDYCLSRGAAPIASLLASLMLTFSAASIGRAAKPTSDGLSYSGRALAFHIDGVTHPTAGPIVVCDTGPLSASGGVLEQHAADVSIAGGALTIESVDAAVAGTGSETLAATALANYSAHFITQDGKDVFITAAYIGASAKVSVNPGGHATGSSNVTIQGLTVNGKAIAISGAPNQVVNLADDEVKLIINEQVSASGNGSGDVAVAAIHFYICECMEGHFGLVSAGISGKGAPPEDHTCGKVTGGGWITGTPSGEKGTFGVSGGVRRDAFWGHLTYIDHGAILKVESTAVTGFQVDSSDANARIITYNVTINGVAGTATVRVADNGEPGRNDTFAIQLSTGYTASGSLGGDRPGGGNIQVHKCPPGWE